MTKKKEREEEVPWQEIGTESDAHAQAEEPEEGEDVEVEVPGDLEVAGDLTAEPAIDEPVVGVPQERPVLVYFRVAKAVEPDPVEVDESGLEVDQAAIIVCDVIALAHTVSHGFGISPRYKTRNVEGFLDLRPRNLQCVIEVPMTNLRRPGAMIQDVVSEVLESQIMGVEIAVMKAAVREEKHKAEVERLGKGGNERERLGVAKQDVAQDL